MSKTIDIGVALQEVDSALDTALDQLVVLTSRIAELRLKRGLVISFVRQMDMPVGERSDGELQHKEAGL